MVKKLFLNLPQFGHDNWWVEIKTFEPNCIYYFGPFSNSDDTSAMCPNYVEDLREEGSQLINAVVKRCNPVQLTIYDEEF